MRNQFYFLLLLILSISCDEKKENKSLNEKVNNENISEIKLTLFGYHPDNNKNFIDIKIENSISPIEEQLKIGNEGIVNYTFTNNRKKEIIFKYDGRKFSMIIDPSEKIDVELKISELLNRSKTEQIEISGINENTNRLILSNRLYIDSLINQSTNYSVKDSSLNNLRYKNKRISEMKHQLIAFSNFITVKNIKDKTFIDWANAQIRYSAGKDICIYPFMGKRSKNLTTKDDFFNFVNDIKFNSKDELLYDSYIDYLNSLTSLYNIMVNVGDAYNEKANLLEKTWPTAYFLKVELVKKLPKGKDREIMMAYLFKNEQRIAKHFDRELPTEYLDSLKFYSNQNLTFQLTQIRTNNKTSITKLIEDYELSKIEKEELIELYNKTKGKVVFHDFWFTNCVPCIKELPNYNDLISTTKNENVEFLFYGVYMENEEWINTIDKFQLKGQHYLLTKNQLAFFEKYFGVQSFPHHQLIKSNGIIGQKVNQGVNPINFDYLKKQIREHQIEK